jgi:MFS family permease
MSTLVHAGPRAQSRAFLPTYVLAFFGAALALTSAAAVSIPLRLSEIDPVGKTGLLGLVAAIGGAVVVLLTAPLGRISDASRSRFGMRRPFILGGSVLGAVGMLLIAAAPATPLIVLGWCVTQAGFAATLMALNALLADQVPTRIRARVAATLGLAQAVAPFVGSSVVGVLPGDPLWWFGVPAVFALLTSGVVVATLRDRVRTEPDPIAWRSLLRSYWINPARHPDFAWAWVCRLLVTMAMLTITLYLLYFLTDRIGVPQDEAASAVGTALGVFFAGTVVTTLVSGWLSDRTGRRKVFVWSSALLTAVGLGLTLTAHDLPTFAIGIAVAGMGQGAFVAVDVAMMTEVLPPSVEGGTGLAVIALSYQLPQLLVPVLATGLLAIGGAGPNYVALFGGAVVATVLGALAVLPIRGVR